MNGRIVNPEFRVVTCFNCPMTLFFEMFNPVSSSVSRNAVSSKLQSESINFPPGNAISPPCCVIVIGFFVIRIFGGSS